MKIALIILACLTSTHVLAEDWVVRGQKDAPATSAQCAVAPAADGAAATSFPKILGKKLSRKEACEFAKSNKSADLGADGKLCAAYTVASQDHCKAEKISL